VTNGRKDFTNVPFTITRSGCSVLTHAIAGTPMEWNLGPVRMMDATLIPASRHVLTWHLLYRREG
jgi:hypothetical protein